MRSQAVEGIPVHGMAASFAGRRTNVDLGRSVRQEWVSSPLGARTGDIGCPEVAEEGSDVRMRSIEAHAPGSRSENRSLIHRR